MLKRFLQWLRWLILAVVAGMLMLFAANNRSQVLVSLFPLPYEAQAPLFLIAILAFLTGMLAGGTFFFLKLMQMRRLLQHARHRASALENELAGLHAQGSPLPAAIPKR